MDRRSGDRGIKRRAAYAMLAALDGHKWPEERSGLLDRRKHDLLAEAEWGLHKPDCSDSYMGVYDALNILITMMERRK